MPKFLDVYTTESLGITIGTKVARRQGKQGEVVKATRKSFKVRWVDGKESQFYLIGANPSCLRSLTFDNAEVEPETEEAYF